MKIESSAIKMTSQHTLVEQELETESLRYWQGEGQGQQPATFGPAQLVSISAKAQELYARQTEVSVKAADEELEAAISDEDKRKMQLIQDMIEMLTGKKIKFVIPRLRLQDGARLTQLPGSVSLQNGQMVQGRPLQGWGLDYQYHYMRSESEVMNFSAAGTVKTADGRVIDFSAQLTMSRQFSEQQHISVKAGDALVDPLVINFDAPAARLTDTKYSFDIDSDGVLDQISFVGGGSGFLTLDLDGDGRVTNGKELFGPNTGNGFAELAKYDSDGNNWIDENDDIYDKLRLWTKDESGNDQLFAIGQKGIGAIYLGNVSTEFAHKSLADNTLQGQLRSTGVFLRENGSVGLVQQIDLAV